MSNTITPPKPEWLEYVRANWNIIPEEGKVFSKGQEIGYPSERGYIRLTLSLGSKKVKIFKRAHIIWWKAKGSWPEQELDHEDRDRANDKISNLRYSTRKKQVHNQEWRTKEPYGSPWKP